MPGGLKICIILRDGQFKGKQTTNEKPRNKHERMYCKLTCTRDREVHKNCKGKGCAISTIHLEI